MLLPSSQAMASHLNLLMAAALVVVVVASSTVAPSAAASWPPAPPRPLFREYLGAMGKNVTFADVPVHPGVDFDFILSFAIDYAANASNASAPYVPTDGIFAVYWDDAHLTPAAIAALKQQHCNASSSNSVVRVALSLGGDTVMGTNVTFTASSVDVWVDNAVASLTAILTRYGIDGVDIDYEHFGERETPEVFAECVGRLVRALKAAGVVTVASMAPFANPDVQAHYGELWRRYGAEFDYVNFQFYAYAANTTVPEFLGYFYEQSGRYANDAAGGAGCGAGGGGKVLVSFSTDDGGGGGLRPGKGFFRACRELRRQGRLHGIFAWAADTPGSLADGFRYERLAQRFLAGAAPGFP